MDTGMGAPTSKEGRGIFDCFNIIVRSNGIEAVRELLKYVAEFYQADDVYVNDVFENVIYEFKEGHILAKDSEVFIKSRIDDNLSLVVINPKEMSENHLLSQSVAFMIFRVLMDEEIQRKYIIEKRQSRIINALSKRFFCIYRVDLIKSEGYLVYAPNYVKRLLGGHGDALEILGIMENNLVEKDYYERVREFNDISQWVERLSDKETISIEFKGTNRWSRSVIIVSTRDEEDKATEILYCVQDIEEQKIREAEQDYKLREALRQANEASQAKSRFLSNMSHDIRTPMNAIVGFSELAKQNLDDKDRVGEYLEEISIASKHLVSLINDVLDMSHIESGKMEINPAPCDITEALKKVRDIMENNAREMGIPIELEFGNIDHKNILCDELKLNQVLFNLIGNSVKYNKKGGDIKLYCKEEPSDTLDKGVYVITVKDSGIGMSKEFLSKIFDTFERERNTTTSNIQGTGLGMSITKALIELMGGTIEIDSEKNVGTTCIVRIPFAWISDAKEEKPEEEENIEALKESIKGRKVLLVEDNLVNQKLATAIFKGLGINIDIAGDGVKALEALKEKEDFYYEVIFMDMQMPIMNGVDATAAIRQLDNKEVAKTPIIMMTANVFEEDKKKAYEVGANGYVAKPINIDELVKEMVRVTKGGKNVS